MTFSIGCQRPTSTTTRIKTQTHPRLSAIHYRCQRPTSTTTRIKTHDTMPWFDVVVRQRPTSTTTRIKTALVGLDTLLEGLVRDLLPQQQGFTTKKNENEAKYAKILMAHSDWNRNSKFSCISLIFAYFVSQRPTSSTTRIKTQQR